MRVMGRTRGHTCAAFADCAVVRDAIVLIVTSSEGSILLNMFNVVGFVRARSAMEFDAQAATVVRYGMLWRFAG